MKHFTTCSDFNSLKAGEVNENDGCICAASMIKPYKERSPAPKNPGKEKKKKCLGLQQRF